MSSKIKVVWIGRKEDTIREHNEWKKQMTQKADEAEAAIEGLDELWRNGELLRVDGKPYTRHGYLIARGQLVCSARRCRRWIQKWDKRYWGGA